MDAGKDKMKRFWRGMAALTRSMTACRALETYGRFDPTFGRRYYRHSAVVVYSEEDKERVQDSVSGEPFGGYGLDAFYAAFVMLYRWLDGLENVEGYSLKPSLPRCLGIPVLRSGLGWNGNSRDYVEREREWQAGAVINSLAFWFGIAERVVRGDWCLMRVGSGRMRDEYCCVKLDGRLVQVARAYGLRLPEGVCDMVRWRFTAGEDAFGIPGSDLSVYRDSAMELRRQLDWPEDADLGHTVFRHLGQILEALSSGVVPSQASTPAIIKEMASSQDRRCFIERYKEGIGLYSEELGHLGPLEEDITRLQKASTATDTALVEVCNILDMRGSTREALCGLQEYAEDSTLVHRYPGAAVYGIASWRLKGSVTRYKYSLFYLNPKPHLCLDALRRAIRKTIGSGDTIDLAMRERGFEWLSSVLIVVGTDDPVGFMQDKAARPEYHVPPGEERKGAWYGPSATWRPHCLTRKTRDKRVAECRAEDMIPAREWDDVDLVYARTFREVPQGINRAGSVELVEFEGISTHGILIQWQQVYAMYIRVPNIMRPSPTASARYFWNCYVRERLPLAEHPNAAFARIFRQRAYTSLTAAARAKLLNRMAWSDVTVGHMVHVDLAAAVWAGRFVWPAFLDTVLQWPGVLQSTVTSIYLWFAMLPVTLQSIMEGWHAWGSASWAEWAKLAKDASVECKALQGLVQFGDTVWDLTPIFELEVLVNRVTTPVDWVKEERNRTMPRLVRVGADRVREICREGFTEARNDGRLPTNEVWERYWDRRYVHTPPGAYFDVYGDENWYAEAKLGSGAKNKKLAFAAMPDDTGMDHFLDRPRCIIARTLIKYEWGKTRALYPCDSSSYILTDFGFLGCEHAMPPNCVAGTDADKLEIVPRLRRMMVGRLPYCIDFEDFNSQHSTENMQAVLEAYKEVFEPFLTNDQLEAIDWVIDGLEHQIVEFPDGHRCHINGTLMSGWRLTSFVNTMLNYAYFRLAEEYCWEQGVSSLSDMHAVHSGDDVFVAVSSPRAAQDIKKGLKAIGARLQASKCFFGSVAEFLRVDALSPDITGAQYLARSVSTMVHSRIESGAPTDCSSLLRAYVTRAEEVGLRGGSMHIVQRVLGIQIADMLGNWPVTIHDIRCFLELPATFGGMSALMRPGVTPNTVVLRSGKASVECVTRLKQLPGLRKAATDIAARLGLVEHSGQAISHLAYEAATGLGRGARYFKAVPLIREKAERYMAEAGRWERLQADTTYTLAKLGGLASLLLREGAGYEEYRSWLHDIPVDERDTISRIAILQRWVDAERWDTILGLSPA